MVSIDTVYQRVLAIANKEQRGYITPQEFNLLANQAQMAIFEQYFYDINQFGRDWHGNDTEYSDMLDLLNKKLAPFQSSGNVTGGATALPANVYRLGTVMYNPSTFDYAVEVEEVKENELLYMNSSTKTRPSAKRPVYTRTGTSTIQIHPTTIVDDVTCTFVINPSQQGVSAKWGYAVVNEKALYNANETTNFLLHASEESNLVIKILELAGVVLNKPGLVQIAQQEEVQMISQQKQ